MLYMISWFKYYHTYRRIHIAYIHITKFIYYINTYTIHVERFCITINTLYTWQIQHIGLL